MPSRRLAPLVLAVVFAACASGGGGAAGAGGTARRNSNLISAEEIAAASGGSAYELVRQLRPSWTVTRGGNTEPVAYVDGIRFGSLEDLRNVAVEQVREIRYLDSRDATTQFGTGHAAGAIVVTTRR